MEAEEVGTAQPPGLLVIFARYDRVLTGLREDMDF